MCTPKEASRHWNNESMNWQSIVNAIFRWRSNHWWASWRVMFCPKKAHHVCTNTICLTTVQNYHENLSWKKKTPLMLVIWLCTTLYLLYYVLPWTRLVQSIGVMFAGAHLWQILQSTDWCQGVDHMKVYICGHTVLTQNMTLSIHWLSVLSLDLWEDHSKPSISVWCYHSLDDQ